jgi:2',3'-cyclic-nucleotide 2'-phosphodiesterase (5'-nucleotidase family)
VGEDVKRLQKELEDDQKFAELFQVIGRIPKALLLTDQLSRQTPLATFIMEIVRKAAESDVALSTTSSFRQPFAPGRLTLEDLRATLPYPNKILRYELSGADLRRLLDLGEAKSGTDAYAQVAGVPATIDPARTYRVATTDYLARVAPGYRDFFAARTATDTGLEVRDEVRKALSAH